MILVNGEGLRSRPELRLEVYQTGWDFWPLFSPHHYLLGAGPMPFGTAYVGFIDGEPVTHLGMSGKSSGRGSAVLGVKANREARACRLVVMPEWQGAGLGMRFLNALCQRELEGDGFIGKATTTQFHTSHPALIAALRRDPLWRNTSRKTVGGSQVRGGAQGRRNTTHTSALIQGTRTTFGGHLRGVTGWRYVGVL